MTFYYKKFFKLNYFFYKILFNFTQILLIKINEIVKIENLIMQYVNSCRRKLI